MKVFMKVVGWILFVVAVLAIPVFAIMHAVAGSDMTVGAVWEDVLISGAIVFCILGSLSHLCVINKSDEDKATKVLYFATFPSFIVLFVIIWVVKKIFKLITNSSGSSSSASGGGKNGTIYVVYDNGYDRQLTFVEFKEDHDHDSPLFGKYYNRFKDDIGNYWRSYDNNENFVKETWEQQQRGY